MLLATGTGRAAWPAEVAGCAVRGITGAGPENAARPDPAQLEAVARALTANVDAFVGTFAVGRSDPFSQGGPGVEPAAVRACVDAIVVDGRARGVLLSGLREAVQAWARDRADAAAQDRSQVAPDTPVFRSIGKACFSEHRRESGQGLGDLYWSIAYGILAEKPAKEELSAGHRPVSARLWPMTLFRDALVEAFANQPDLALALSPPPAPAVILQGDAVRVPLPADTPAYRAYLTWLEPAAWPGNRSDAPANRLLGAALDCLGSSRVLSALRYARSY